MPFRKHPRENPTNPMIRLAILAAFTLVSGCGTILKPITPPEPPASLVRCAMKATAEIPEGPLSRSQVAELVAKIRASELGKDRCARDWLEYYADISSED